MEFNKENTAALGKIPSGLFIVTAKDGEKRDGYLASWVQQISFSPLLITLAIKPGRPCYDLIKSGKPFVVNIVGHNNSGMMKPFWGAYQPGVDPFTSLDLDENEERIILNQGIAALKCRLLESTKPGDHELVIAEILECILLKDDDKPMVHIRKSGLDY